MTPDELNAEIEKYEGFAKGEREKIIGRNNLIEDLHSEVKRSQMLADQYAQQADYFRKMRDSIETPLQMKESE